jgi:peptidoglycan/xylan/chitin deacetylase (PgdA/CDA1 family)
MSEQASGIPVTYYHSVGEHPRPRPKSFLSMSEALFEEQILRLRQFGYETIDLSTLHAHVSKRHVLSGKHVVLTFDDGFLDNWTTVFPLAKKHGFKFTVVVNPDFVDPRPIVRPTLEDVWSGKIRRDQMEWWGMMSWDEMRLMEASGLVDIQSHALTHTWHHADPEVIDFHRPDSPHHWLVWNAHPETKPFFFSDYREELVPYGTPVHRFRKSIQARRWIPDSRHGAAVIEHVDANGGRSFFDREVWKDELLAVHARVRAELGDQGRFETDAEHEARIREEVAGSKRIIEERLAKRVDFICWPGGGETELARRIALESGYLATTKGTAVNRPGGDPTHISRVASWFPGRAPDFLKWWLFRGQMERGRGVHTPAALFCRLLSCLRKSVTP